MKYNRLWKISVLTIFAFTGLSIINSTPIFAAAEGKVPRREQNFNENDLRVIAQAIFDRDKGVSTITDKIIQHDKTVVIPWQKGPQDKYKALGAIIGPQNTKHFKKRTAIMVFNNSDVENVKELVAQAIKLGTIIKSVNLANPAEQSIQIVHDFGDPIGEEYTRDSPKGQNVSKLWVAFTIPTGVDSTQGMLSAIQNRQGTLSSTCPTNKTLGDGKPGEACAGNVEADVPVVAAAVAKPVAAIAKASVAKAPVIAAPVAKAPVAAAPVAAVAKAPVAANAQKKPIDNKRNQKAKKVEEVEKEDAEEPQKPSGFPVRVWVNYTLNQKKEAASTWEQTQGNDQAKRSAAEQAAAAVK